MPATTNISSLITSIQDSQTTEGQLIAQLDTLSSQANFNPQSPVVTTLLAQIQSLSDARIAMFRSLSDQATILQSGVANSRVDLVSQLTLLNVVNDQLIQARASINNLQGQNDTKKRMVEVNTYYGKRYEAQSNLMKLIIMFCAPLLVLFILKKKSLLPPMISNYLIGITMAIGLFMVIQKMWDISTRSNMDYDEYSWEYTDPSATDPSIWEYNKKNAYNFENPLKALVGNLGSCFGEGCCADGLFYDKTKQQCTTLKAGGSAAGAEGFVCSGNNKLQATNVVVFDPEEEEQNGISPFSYGSGYASIA
jgi:hypothetical protein